MSDQKPYPQYPSPPQSGYGFVGHPDAIYGASFGEAVTRFFKRYADFRGHASRSEYWWTQLAIFIFSFVLNIIIAVGGVDTTGMTNSEPNALGLIGALLFLAFLLAIIIPSLALSWRRLHDAGMSGLFYLLTLVPFVGSIIILVLMLMPTKPHNNTHKWG